MKRIRVLDDATINSIAAGEVVESPSSVLKELVDNALDSGATAIDVEYLAGGLKLLRVADNGSGMEKEDFLLSVRRHATSKVETIDDVTSVETMGFRGEALASIGAVSKLRMITSVGGDGLELSVIGGVEGEVEFSPRSQGTTVEVCDLFFNVPARRKFQKAPPAAAAELIKTFIALTLANPSVSFSLSTSGRAQMKLSATSLTERIKDVLGSDFCAGSYVVAYKAGQIQVEGIVAAPSRSKLTRAGQHLIVNGRPIKSMPISFAAKDGYGTRLEEKKHPPFVLSIHLPPQEVDVNVHPQKKEVRFKNEAMVKEVVRKSVSMSFLEQREPVSRPVFSDFTSDEPLSFSFKEPPRTEYVQPSFTNEVSFVISGKWKHFLFLDGKEFSCDLPIKKDGLIVVNLKAVSRRLFFDAMEEGRAEMQNYHTPVTVNSDATEAECKTVLQAGIDARPFGNGVIAIEAARKEIKPSALPLFFEEALQVLRENRNVSEKVKSRLQLLALSSMKERWDYKTEAEARLAVASVLKSKEPMLCPKGEPIFRQYDETALEKGRL